jgi:60 kDa SS-A/Ro ribonucleoprotein
LYHFIDYASKMRGLGRGLRSAVARWFYSREADQLAYQIVKYQQRDGWSARDCLRVAHPNDADPGRQAIYRWIVGGMDALGARSFERKVGTKKVKVEYPSVRAALPTLIEVFEKAKTADEKTLVKLITEHRLPREAIPTDKLNSLPVWEALLQHMPMTAMIRNLGKMTAIGLIKPLSDNAKLVVNQLGSEKALKKARIHPMQILLAAKTYAQGHGIKGDLRWSPVPTILTALDRAFYDTFPNVTPAGKPLLIALDVSGSMGSSIMGAPITSCEAVAALSLVHCNVEPECHVFGFADTFRDLRIRKGMTLEQACQHASCMNFGSTNVSLAYEFALKHKLKVGGFIVMTDSETNGGTHPALRLREYRDRFTPDARSVVVATTSTSFTINDPTDKYGLDVAGFDASVPRLIADFIRDDLGKAVPAVEDEPAAE